MAITLKSFALCVCVWCKVLASRKLTCQTKYQLGGKERHLNGLVLFESVAMWYLSVKHEVL